MWWCVQDFATSDVLLGYTSLTGYELRYELGFGYYTWNDDIYKDVRRRCSGCWVAQTEDVARYGMLRYAVKFSGIKRMAHSK